MESKIIIYTDGSSLGNPGPGGWGAIVANSEVVEIGGREERTTNNRMELRAIIEGLKALDRTKGNVTICTDSSYVIQGITKWVKHWKNNGWMTSAKKEVMNRDLWEGLHHEVEEREMFGMIIWEQVEGHVGIPANERVDIIATSLADGKRPDLYKGPRNKYPINLFVVPANRTKKVIKDDRRARSNQKAYSYISLVEGKVMTHATWAECESRVRGKKARFKKALSRTEEEEIIKDFSQK